MGNGHHQHTRGIDNSEIEHVAIVFSSHKAEMSSKEGELLRIRRNAFNRVRDVQTEFIYR